MQTRLLEAPRLLRSVCDEISRTENAAPFSSIMESRAYVPSSSLHRKRRNCSCRPSTYSLRIPFWGANLSSSALIHGEDCDLFKYPEREDSWNLRVVYCGRLIAQAVTASMHLRRGAGGFSISPNLHCSRVVSSESPIFDLIDTQVFGIFDKKTNITSELNALMRKIEQLFRDGKASPRDVNEQGDSLLHVSHLACYSDSRSNKIRCFKRIAWQLLFVINYDTYEITRLIEYLLHLGVPLNEVNARGAYVPALSLELHIGRLILIGPVLMSSQIGRLAGV